MSGLFGLFHASGPPVSREEFEALRRGLGAGWADAFGEFQEGTIALGQAHCFNAPEGAGEALPLVEGPPGRRLAIVADVRLDNREELLRALGLRVREGAATSDAALLLAAYRQWGEKCPARLLGDFAYAIWDEEAGRVLLVRDPVGIKCLYFHRARGRVVFSNDLRCLLAHPEISREIDEASVARYLRDGELYDPERTLFRAVRRLPPATLWSFDDRERTERYWTLEPSDNWRLSADGEYVEVLRDLLRQAVRDRLRSPHPVAAQLSGGLDSSFVASLAARLLRERGESLWAYNWASSPGAGDDPEHFEVANARQVASAEGFELGNVALDAQTVGRFLAEASLGANETVDSMYEFAALPALQDRDYRVVLTGWGGDELISNEGARVNVDALRRGRPDVALRSILRQWWRGPKTPRRLAGLGYRELILPTRILTEPDLPEWPACYAPGIQSEARALPSRQALTRSASQVRQQLDFFRIGHLAHRAESWGNLGRRFRVEYRHPLLDRRILEFAVSVPPRLYRRDRETRHLFREAARGFVPEAVRRHVDKFERVRGQQLLDAMLGGLETWCADREVGGAEGQTSTPVDATELCGLLASLQRRVVLEELEQVERLKWLFKGALLHEATAFAVPGAGAETRTNLVAYNE